ncbi:MAG TPA: SpoIIE family protein phosphatase, partial [Bacteroidia bacterium]|nr:SpoIIE family protein phosphatase [Bacteroidia bacterium]
MAIQQGKADVTVGFWVMVYILFVFFLFGRTWGIILTLLMQIIAGVVINFSQLFEIPQSEKYQATPLEIIVPFLLNIVIVWVFIKTRTEAEQEIKNQHNQIEEKSKELEIKNKDIQDSINYAKRIQYAVLPHEETIYRSIPLSFIFYKPKDIVSGDFFWFHELNRDEYILVCADCTGHGVPGAFMTVIGSSLLNQTVIDNKITKPSEILNELDKQINFTLKQQKDTDSSVQDGMDLSLIKVNKAKNQIILTSAKRPVVFVKNNELKEIRGNKYSMGGMRTGDKVFEEIELNYSEGDVLYLYTDGYADQFGGPKG